MKKICLLCVVLLLGIIFVSGCITGTVDEGQITSADKADIAEIINEVAKSVNDADSSYIISIISPNAREGLEEEIEVRISGKFINFEQEINSFEESDNGQIKVNTIHAASGWGWEIYGVSSYYIFERSEDSFLLIDTDFHQKIDSGYVWGLLKGIFLIFIPIMIIFGIFWLWMLIDCLKRGEFEDKTMWLLLVLFFGIIGAILYFFIKRKELIRGVKNGR